MEDPTALALVQAMTTDHVWDERLNAANVATGDWVSFELDDDGAAPMAWEMRANYDYRRGPKRNLRKVRRIGRLNGRVAPAGMRL